ncbi:hypothetical protein [Nocardia sp. XZ_19_385]|uniref:hypothetical protein n=1 Tax=Nocardia sp. XZ_19_385 TaxID=2769488 RepID=UPI00188FBA40|nr:hypothetical protein [Nocardia sp. XZ_19_385]
MQTRTALRGATAAFALCAALAGGSAAASAEPLKLEPAAPETTVPVSEQMTSTGSSTISASVNARIACIFQNTLSGHKLDC